MPTQKKEQIVAEIKRLVEGSTVTITADYTGMSVSAMTDLRRALREADVEFHVVKNRLAHIAADEASKPLMKEIVQGPTGMAFGFNDPVQPAKAIVDYINNTKAPLKITGGLLGERQLSAQEVASLAALPSRDELVARLMAQLQSPIARLAMILNAPLTGLVTVLNRASENRPETT